MKSLYQWKEVLIASASAIVGVIIGPLLEKVIDPFFSSEVRTLLFVFLIQSLLFVIIVTNLGIYIRRNENLNQDLAEELKGINQKMGLHGEFLADLPRENGVGTLYMKANEIIAKAEKSIWVLWYQRPPETNKSEEDVRSDVWKHQRDRYHDLIMEKCHDHRRDAYFYRRILQLPQCEKIKDGIVAKKIISTTMVQHCRTLLKFIEQYPEAATLRYAPVLLRNVFVLVDDRYILWEIDATDPTLKANYMDGLVVFDDIDGKFIQYLKNFMLKVETHSLPVKQISD